MGCFRRCCSPQIAFEMTARSVVDPLHRTRLEKRNVQLTEKLYMVFDAQ